MVETHHGGEFDATNLVTNPIVTAVTLIGRDHILQPGPTIENITWHKAGIFKKGALAFSAPQPSEVSAQLEQRAVEKGVDLQFVQRDGSLPAHLPAEQRLNCSLAIQMSNAFLAYKKRLPLSTHDILQGIQAFHWPGRFHTVTVAGRRFFLEGAHNELSITGAATWFAESSQASEGSSTSYVSSSVLPAIVTDICQRGCFACQSHCLLPDGRESRHCENDIVIGAVASDGYPSCLCHDSQTAL